MRNDVIVSGVKIPAGDKVLCFLPSDNRDEAYFEDGDNVDISRENARKHIAFGFGRHVCMGAPLARFELVIILEELSKRLPQLRLIEGKALKQWKPGKFVGRRSYG